MRQCAGLTALILAGVVLPSVAAFAQKRAPQQNVTVTVVNVGGQPAQPVQGAGIALSYLDSAVRILDAQDVTNTKGEALLIVSSGVAERGDLRIEITRAHDLVIYQPADGELPALGAALQVSLLPKGSPALLGPAQIEAMLHRTLLQVNSLQRQNQALKQEIATAQNQKPDLAAALAAWAQGNGFPATEVDQRVQAWAEEIQRDTAHATLEQQAVAAAALQQFASAAQLFNQAADADSDALNADAVAEKAFLDRERTHLQQLIKDREQSASASQLNLQYHQATQTMESADATAQAEYKKHSDDRGFHELWLQALLSLASVRLQEGEVAPADRSLPLLARSADDFQSIVREAAIADDQQQAAAAESGLGSALVDQGLRAGGDKSVALLEQAVQAYEKALEVRTRGSFPLEWADTEANLAGTLDNEAQRVAGGKSVILLDRAAKAYQSVLEVYTRADSPQDWARTQTGLGVTLATEGLRASGDQPAALTTQAVQAFKSALEVYTKAETPRYWAMAQNDLGNTLANEAYFSQANGDPALLDQAVEAIQRALEVYTKAESPQDWARAEFSLGTALSDASLATEGEKAAALAAQAIVNYRKSLEVYDRAGLPQDWAHANSTIGYCLWIQAVNTSGAPSLALLDQSVRAFQNALEVYTKESLPQSWAWTQEHLALALGDESLRTTGATSASFSAQARQAFEKSLEVYTRAELPRNWAEVEMDLVEETLRGGSYDACLQNTNLLSDDAVFSAEIPIRDTMKLACEWGSGDKSAALTTAKTLVAKAAVPPKDAWDFTGTIGVLATAPAFAMGRASWIALFTAVENGDGAGMTAALHQLEPILQQ